MVSGGDNLVPRDTNLTSDVFLHERWNGEGANSIVLIGPYSAPLLTPITLSWEATQGDMPFWLLQSRSLTGSIFHEHQFDLGLDHLTVVASGVLSSNGLGSYTGTPAAAMPPGYTLHFEVAARDAHGAIYDSDAHAVSFY